MPDRKEIIEELLAYNEDERFYQKMHYARSDPDTLMCFLQQIDVNLLRSRRLLVPEYYSAVIPELIETRNLDELTLFDKNNPSDVILCKHNRYSPVIPHRHTYFELLYVLEGKCDHIVNGVKTKIRTGDLIFIAPGITHAISVFDNTVVINIIIRSSSFSSVFFNILRSENLISAFFRNGIYEQSKAGSLVIHTCGDDDIKNSILDMYHEQKNGTDYTNLIIYSMLCVFFARLMQDYDAKVELVLPFPSSEENAEEQRLLTYIADHYNTVTLDELASVFHCSSSHCSRNIKKYTGMTFSQLIKKHRFLNAETLLLNTNTPIDVISQIVGYENPESFIRVFKGEYGMTPGKFRQR